MKTKANKHKISHHFSEMKNIIDAFSSRLDIAYKRISELEV